MVARKLPCSSNGRSMALVLRECLAQLDFTYDYRIGRRHFSRFTFVITLDRFTRTFRFKVTRPVEFEIECWDESPGHGGKLHYLEVSRFDGGSRRQVTRLLRLLAISLPRLPWKFKFTHRLGVGYLLPDFVRARKAWARMGVTERDLEGLRPVDLTLGELDQATRHLDEGPLDDEYDTGDGEEEDEVDDEVDDEEEEGEDVDDCDEDTGDEVADGHGGLDGLDGLDELDDKMVAEAYRFDGDGKQEEAERVEEANRAVGVDETDDAHKDEAEHDMTGMDKMAPHGHDAGRSRPVGRD